MKEVWKREERMRSRGERVNGREREERPGFLI